MRARHWVVDVVEENAATLEREDGSLVTVPRAQLPAGTVVAHKTGTGPDVAGINAVTNDIGLITLANGRHVAVAVFVATSAKPLAVREATIAQIAKAAYDYFATK